MDFPTATDSVQLRVELPSYSYSFNIDVPLDGSVADVKRIVHSRCMGNPSVEGQRIIWRGRALGDTEKVVDLWKPSDSVCVVLLAVHPSAWTTSPPTVPVSSSSQSDTFGMAPTPAQTQGNALRGLSNISIHPLSSRPTPTLPSDPLGFAPIPQRPFQTLSRLREPPVARREGPEINTIPYVAHQHKNALITLVGGIRIPPPTPLAAAAGRARSVDTLARWGYLWPAILDEDYPASDAEEAIYEISQIEDRSYLKLRQPHLKPTPAQIHALKVLTYTFPIMVHSASRSPDPAQPHSSLRPGNGSQVRIPLNRDQVHLPPNINELLQQLGLPRIQLQQGANARLVNHANGAAQNGIAELPLRRLLIPLTMLLLRTALLLYFVAPIRKPVFAALVLMWVIYEGWQAIRSWFGQIGRARGEGQPQARAPGAAPGVNVPQPQVADGVMNAPMAPGAGINRPAGPAFGGGVAVPRMPLTFEQQAASIFNALSNVNIQTEDYFLSIPDSRLVVHRISFLTRLTTFIILFFVTLHPAAWNKRRSALRQREGRIRTEAAIRRSDAREVIDGDEGDNNSETRTHSVENRTFNERRRKLINDHARKPAWMREYVDRVVAGDWVDEAD